MQQQGCRYVPYTFSETKPQMELNIAFQSLALMQGPNLQPGWTGLGWDIETNAGSSETCPEPCYLVPWVMVRLFGTANFSRLIYSKIFVRYSIFILNDCKMHVSYTWESESVKAPFHIWAKDFGGICVSCFLPFLGLGNLEPFFGKLCYQRLGSFGVWGHPSDVTARCNSHQILRWWHLGTNNICCRVREGCWMLKACLKGCWTLPCNVHCSGTSDDSLFWCSYSKVLTCRISLPFIFCFANILVQNVQSPQFHIGIMDYHGAALGWTKQFPSDTLNIAKCCSVFDVLKL